MGFEGANVIFDTWVHPLVMGLEEHLLHMFREDFEFHDAAGASHHGGRRGRRSTGSAPSSPALGRASRAGSTAPTDGWPRTPKRELKKIPFFVRGKARRNTETFAAERGLSRSALDTLYEAKAHYAR